MTASKQAKAEGLKSLSQVSEMTGQSLQTLSNWAKNKPELFKIVLLGCIRNSPRTLLRLLALLGVKA